MVNPMSSWWRKSAVGNGVSANATVISSFGALVSKHYSNCCKHQWVECRWGCWKDWKGSYASHMKTQESLGGAAPYTMSYILQENKTYMYRKRYEASSAPSPHSLDITTLPGSLMGTHPFPPPCPSWDSEGVIVCCSYIICLMCLLDRRQDSDLTSEGAKWK